MIWGGFKNYCKWWFRVQLIGLNRKGGIDGISANKNISSVTVRVVRNNMVRHIVSRVFYFVEQRPKQDASFSIVAHTLVFKKSLALSATLKFNCHVHYVTAKSRQSGYWFLIGLTLRIKKHVAPTGWPLGNLWVDLCNATSDNVGGVSLWCDAAAE